MATVSGSGLSKRRSPPDGARTVGFEPNDDVHEFYAQAEFERQRGEWVDPLLIHVSH